MIAVMGTAMWGWKIDRPTAFMLADRFVEKGWRWFDTASNYPIDKNRDHFGLAERYLTDWNSLRGADISLILKVGSVANDGSPVCDLSADFLNSKLEAAIARHGANLKRLAIHWDDRTDPVAVGETLAFFRSLKARGIGLGISGIRYPDLYAQLASDLMDEWQIQIRYNPLSSSAYGHYERFHRRRRFMAYGLNCGGLKLDRHYTPLSSATLRGVATDVNLDKYQEFIGEHRGERNAPRSLNELAVLCAAAEADIEGVLVGASDLAQLDETLACVQSTYSPDLMEAARDLMRL